jgi:hypothetical protein
VKKEVPYFSGGRRTPVPLVTDNEVAPHEAAGRVLENVSTLQCWNHLINSLKVWLRQHGAGSKEIPILLQQVSTPNILGPVTMYLSLSKCEYMSYIDS